MQLFSPDLALPEEINPKLFVRNFLEDPTQKFDYEPVWQAMRDFTRQRELDSPDELWLLQHTPVYTLGQAGDTAHLLNPQSIPVIKVDRGGQVTYHGPGQLMCYTLLNLRRYQLSVRSLVELIETVVVELLAGYGISASGNRNAPGVYVDGKKIAALGLRVSRGCSYHGMSFNVELDTSPFDGINPCGYRDMQVTQLVDLLPVAEKPKNVFSSVSGQLSHLFAQKLNDLIS